MHSIAVIENVEVGAIRQVFTGLVAAIPVVVVVAFAAVHLISPAVEYA